MRDAGVPRAVLVGHSMGGIVIRRFARAYPDRVIALVPVDSSVRRRPEADRVASATAELAAFVNQLRGAAYQSAAARFIDSMFVASTPAVLREEIKRRMLSTPPHVALSALENTLTPEMLWDDRPIRVPVLELVARYPQTPPDQEQFLRGFIPKLEYRVIEGAGHFLMLERPAAVNRLLLDFLARVAQPKSADWQSLFDGKSLRGWRETPFTGRGTVRVENGAIVLGSGAPMTGVTWTGSFPRTGYEVRLEAARLAGGDFFASMTFPVGDSFCTWVTGGWGGDIVGLSSIDGWDAADNETRSYFNFENGRWYALRLRVAAGRITAWIDGRPIINVEIAGRSVGLREGEMKLSAPFGFASYASTGALRKIEYRLLPR
jgi:surfactin synthase thioesterase subunit